MKLGPLHIPTSCLFIHLIVIACLTFACLRNRTISEIFNFSLGIGTFAFGTAEGAAGIGISFEINQFDFYYDSYIHKPSDFRLLHIDYSFDGDVFYFLMAWPTLIITYAVASITYAIIRVKRNHLSQRTDPT